MDLAIDRRFHEHGPGSRGQPRWRVAAHAESPRVDCALRARRRRSAVSNMVPWLMGSFLGRFGPRTAAADEHQMDTRDFNEVKTMGSLGSVARTPDQTTYSSSGIQRRPRTSGIASRFLSSSLGTATVTVKGTAGTTGIQAVAIRCWRMPDCLLK